MTLNEVVNKYNGAADYLISIGVIKDLSALQLIGNMNLDIALKAKGINKEIVINALKEMGEKTEESFSYKIKGILPCPVKLQLLNQLNLNLSNEADMEIKSASSGIDWFMDEYEEQDIIISAGFDFIFDKKIRGKGIYKDYSSDTYSKDLSELKDPLGEVNFLGAVPAIMVVTENMLDGRKMPESWEDILSEEFEDSISLPVGDFDLFNAILLVIDRLYGIEGVRKLSRSMSMNMHPSEMIASKSKVCVNIMPYFFSKMAKAGVKVVWPKEGAITSPILMMAKKESEEEIGNAVKLINSTTIAEILKFGRFPATNPNIDNNLPGKMLWLGWDYIDNTDITAKIEELKKVFNEGL